MSAQHSRKHTDAVRAILVIVVMGLLLAGALWFLIQALPWILNHLTVTTAIVAVGVFLLAVAALFVVNRFAEKEQSEKEQSELETDQQNTKGAGYVAGQRFAMSHGPQEEAKDGPQHSAKGGTQDKWPSVRHDLDVSKEINSHPAWLRLNDQLSWYDHRSSLYRKRYQQSTAAQLVLAGAIPVFSLMEIPWGRWITAILGASVALLAGLQQLGQYHNLWTDYQATAEQLKREKYLFLAHSGPYRDLENEDALKLMAERVEELVSMEHAKWVHESSKRGEMQTSSN